MEMHKHIVQLALQNEDGIYIKINKVSINNTFLTLFHGKIFLVDFCILQYSQKVTRNKKYLS